MNKKGAVEPMSEETQRSEPVETAPGMSRTILVADEDNGLIERICLALENASYRVLVAQDCSQVMALIEQADLLMTDDRLPGDGGFAVLRVLRENPQTAAIPVIMLTSELEDVEVYRAWQSGVDSFQSKRPCGLPALTVELLVKIKRIFKSLDEDRLRGG